MRGLFQGQKRSLSTRLLWLNAGLVLLCSGALVLLVAWLADRFMLYHLDESVEAELSLLAAEHQLSAPKDVQDLIQQRLTHPSEGHQRFYRFESAQGGLLAGNVQEWPSQLQQPDRIYTLETLSPYKTRLMFVRFTNRQRLLVGFSEIELAGIRKQIRLAAAIGLLVSGVLSILVSAWISRLLRRAIARIDHAAHQVIAGDLSHRIPQDHSRDEFDRLNGTLNAMLDRIHHLMEAMKSATDNIAHDLRTPLARHRARLEQNDHNPPDRDSLLAEVDGLLITFNALLKLSTVESGLLRSGFAKVDLSAVCRDAFDLYEAAFSEAGLQAHLDLAQPAWVCGDRHLLFQALVNVLDNALKYGQGYVRLSLQKQAQDWHVQIADGGTGVPEALRERVFERLYRMDKSRSSSGTGLGLSMARAVARLHQGECAFSDQSTVQLRLPVLDHP